MQTASLTAGLSARLSALSELATLPGSASPRELLAMRRDPLAFLHTRFAMHGPVFKSNLVVPCVFVVGEAWNRTVLVTRRAEFGFGKGYARTAVRHVFEDSIMLLDGADHARTRAALAPAVSRLSVRESVATMRALWAAQLARAARERSADAYGLAEGGTFDVAARILLGLEIGKESDAFRAEFEKLIAGMLALVPVPFPFGRLAAALSARKALFRMLTPHVERMRTRGGQGLAMQLFEVRDERGQGLSSEEIVGHLLLLAWAGYDTTASAATWLLVTLAERHDLQERLREELSRVDPDDAAALETGKGLSDTECFLLELERMYPSAVLFPRITTARVAHDGFVIPEDTLVLYTPYLSHRDPASFTHPNTFDPERFSARRGASRNTAAQLFGFGGGPRICLGKPFAKLQLKVLLHTLLSRYDVEPDPTVRPEISVFPVHHPVGVRVRLTPRTP
jgi:cytochrome P450